MNKDEEKRLSQLSDSQIRDSFDALFWLSPEQQNSSTTEANGDLPVIQTNPPIGTCQTKPDDGVTADPIMVNKPFGSTQAVQPPLPASHTQFTSQLPLPMTVSLLPQLGFMPSAAATANAMYNPDALALLTNATASLSAATAPTLAFPGVTQATSIPQPHQEELQDTNKPSKKRKAATGTLADSFLNATRSPMVCSEDESELKHRRMDRNAREQHRAQQITLQIAALRDLLMKTSNIQFKPDKFSTLLTAAQYIRQLQKKEKTLTAEHQSLLRTLKKTSETLQRSATGGIEDDNEKVDQLSETFIHQGIPYRVLFQMCPAPMCLVRMDGRFLDANAMFEQLLDTQMNRLKGEDTTFFNVLERSSIENVFCAMSRLLEVPSSLISSDLTEVTSGATSPLPETHTDAKPADSKPTDPTKSVVSMTSSSDDSTEQTMKDSFSEDVVLAHNGQQTSLRITIVRSEETQIPRFFACTFSTRDSPPCTTTSSTSSSTFLSGEVDSSVT